MIDKCNRRFANSVNLSINNRKLYEDVLLNEF